MKLLRQIHIWWLRWQQNAEAKATRRQMEKAARRKETLVDRYRILRRLQWLAGIGCGLIASYAVAAGTKWQIWQIFGVGMLAGGAALCSGFAVGFVFAIPQEERKGTETDGASLENRAGGPIPNDNLKEISDWLTKIIVGVGLVELKQVPGALKGLAWYLGPGLRAPGNAGDGVWIAERAGLTIVLYYLMTGFLLGYIWTKLYFHGDLLRARRLERKLKKARMVSKLRRLALTRALLVSQAEAEMGYGHLEEALSLIDKALSSDKTDARGLITKGRILRRQAEQKGVETDDGTRLLRQAIALLDQAIQEGPYKAEGLYNKGCYLLLLEEDQAVVLETLEKAFELNGELRIYARTDHDLQSLLGIPQFRRMVGLRE